MTVNLQVAGAGRGLPSVDGPAPAPPCIRCGGLEGSHFTAFHRFTPQPTCISCLILPAVVIHHGYPVCGGCALDGAYGSVLVG